MIKKIYSIITILIILTLILSITSCKDPVQVKLEEIENKYSDAFRDSLESIDNSFYLEELINDDRIIEILNNIYKQKEEYFNEIVELRYTKEEIENVSKTISYFEGNNNYRNIYLSYVFDPNLSFISLDEKSKLFKKFYDENYTEEKISSYVNVLKENKDYCQDVLDSFNKVLIQLNLDKIYKEKEKQELAIELQICEGPTLQGDICYYRIRAIVTGSPTPEIVFSKDDSNGAWGKNIAQVNLHDISETYTLTATAINTQGTATDLIEIIWGCDGDGKDICKSKITKEKELRKNLETIIQDPYFKKDEERIKFIDDVLELKKKGIKIEYMFSDILDNYNPQEQLLLVNAFYELEFSDEIFETLTGKLNEAENCLDADGDGYSNFSEITGLDEYGNPLPFIDKDTGEPITYANEKGKIIKDGSSNPLDPKDTPEHMAKFDFVDILGFEKQTNLELEYWYKVSKDETFNTYSDFVEKNPCLDEILLVDLSINSISLSEIYKKIENFSDSDYMLVSWNAHGSHDKTCLLGSEVITEQELLNLCNLLYKKYEDGAILQYSTCSSGSMSKLPSSGIFIFQATESLISPAMWPQYEFIAMLKKFPFIDLGEAHNETLVFSLYPSETPGEDYPLMKGLQYCVKSVDNDQYIYWDRYGPFEFAKDSNGNYIRWPAGNIKRGHLAYQKVEKGQGNYILEDGGRYILSEDGNYIRRELIKEEIPPKITNFFMNELFK